MTNWKSQILVPVISFGMSAVFGLNGQLNWAYIYMGVGLMSIPYVYVCYQLNEALNMNDELIDFVKYYDNKKK